MGQGHVSLDQSQFLCDSYGLYGTYVIAFYSVQIRNITAVVRREFYDIPLPFLLPEKSFALFELFQ